MLGLLITFIGTGIIIVQGVSNNTPFSIIDSIKNMGLFSIIPFAFLIIGLYQTLWTIFTPSAKLKQAILKNTEKQNDLEVKHTKMIIKKRKNN